MLNERIQQPAPYQEFVHPQIHEIRVYPSKEKTARGATDFIEGAVRENPQGHFSFATGDTMIPVYENLVNDYRKILVDFTQITATHLDEYWLCQSIEPHSFVKYIKERVFEPLKISQAFAINGFADDPRVEAERYDRLLAQLGPVELTLLGIGPGGHIGFNEKGNTTYNCRTRYVELSKETIIRDVQRGQKRQKWAITQGIDNIVEAKKILLVAYGKEKGELLQKALYGPITDEFPASLLRYVKDKVTIIIDQEAAKQLRPNVGS